MKLLFVSNFLEVFLLAVVVTVKLSSSTVSAAATTMTSACTSSGSTSLVTEFPVLGGSSITLSTMDTASVLASRGCSPSYSWKYAVATQSPTLAAQQNAYPNTLSTWSVDPLSGSLSFAAGSTEGVSTVVEKLQCYSSSYTPIDACVITHQVVVYQNLGVTTSPRASTTSTTVAAATTRAPTTALPPQVTGNNIGPCSPVYGFYVSTSSATSTTFTSTLEGFTGETKCPTGLAANYKLVQAPAKQSSSAAFVFTSKGNFTYIPAASTQNSYDNDYFRFTKYCGAYSYCSASAYLVLQPKAQPTTTAPAPPVTVGRCPDVYYFTTNQALSLGTVAGGFACPASASSPLMMFTTFDTTGFISISDPSVGAFTVNNNVPFTTSAAGWADFSFNAQCVATATSCIGIGHVMLLPAPATSAPAVKQCQPVYQKWSPTLSTPLSLAQSVVGSAGCVYAITTQPDFVSIALIPTTGQFTLTFTVLNPVGWIMIEFDKSCPATTPDPSSATACHGFAYVQAVPATDAPIGTTTPLAIGCPALNYNGASVFVWNGLPLSVATSPVALSNSSTTTTAPSYCSNYALDYDTDRPVPPITLSTQSGSFAFSSFAPAGWTNFSFKYSCFTSTPTPQQIDCVGNAAVLVGPNVPPPPPGSNSTAVCAASPNTADLLFSYVWKIGTTQSIALVDSTGQICSSFSSFQQQDQNSNSLFAVDATSGLVTLVQSNTNNNNNNTLDQGWKNFSLQVSCTAPQTFTCMTRVFILVIYGALPPTSATTTTATTTPPAPTPIITTLVNSTSSGNSTDSPTASAISSTITVVTTVTTNGNDTSYNTTTSSNGTDTVVPTTIVATSTNVPVSTIAASTTPVPVPSGYLTAFANLQCKGTCDQQSWKTISFIPDLWDDTPIGGATLLPNSPVTNPAHITRQTDSRPIDDVSANYDALKAPNLLILSATGEIGNMGARFPTFESLSSPRLNLSTVSSSPYNDYGTNTKALPGRLTSANLLSVVSASSLPFDVKCFDTQSLFYGVAEQIWAWDDIASLQGHSVPGEYNGGAPNYFHKFGGKHQSCDTMSSRPLSCKYAPFLTPNQDTSANNKWSLTVDGCDLTWVASNMDATSILNSFVKKNGIDHAFAPNSQASANAAQSAQRSGSLQTAVLEATVFSEAVKPVSWTSPAKGTLINEKPFTVPVRVTQWVSADREGKNVHRTSFAVRGLTSVVTTPSSPSSPSGPVITFTLDLVAPSAVGSAFVPAIKGVEIDSVSSTNSINNNNNNNNTKFNCQFMSSTFNQDASSTLLALPLAFVANASDCADTNQSAPFFTNVKVVRISNNVVIADGTSSNTAAAEPITTFQVQLTLPASSGSSYAVFPFEGYVALRLLLVSTRDSNNMWVERYILRAGTSVTGVDAQSTASSSASSSSAIPSPVVDILNQFDVSVCAGDALVDPSSLRKTVITGEEDDTVPATTIPPAQIATLSTAYGSAGELGKQVCRLPSESSSSSTIKDTGAVVAGSDSFTLCAYPITGSSIKVPEFEYIVVSQVNEDYENSNSSSSLYRIAIIPPSSASSLTTTDVLLPWNVVAPFAQVFVHQSNLTTFAPIGVAAISINNIGSLCPRSTNVQNTKKSCRLRFDIAVRISSSIPGQYFTRSVFAFVDNTLDNLAINNTASWQATVEHLPAYLLVQTGVVRATQGSSFGYGVAVAIFGALVLVALVVLYIDKKSAQNAAQELIINQPKRVAEFIKNFMFKSENVKFADESEFVRGSDSTAKVSANEVELQAATEKGKTPKSATTTSAPKMKEETTRVPEVISSDQNNKNNNSQKFVANVDDDDLISASSGEASDRHQKETEEKERKANLMKLKLQLREQQQQKQQDQSSSSSSKAPSVPGTANVDDLASPAPTRPRPPSAAPAGHDVEDEHDPLYE